MGSVRSVTNVICTRPHVVKLCEAGVRGPQAGRQEPPLLYPSSLVHHPVYRSN